MWAGKYLIDYMKQSGGLIFQSKFDIILELRLGGVAE
jgi:hypothetical protein